ncbi:MAG: CBS and ACT domain-containing protein [Oscillospiraceae bacterium]|nr:CBS and ACT domain-containing protein [Oscillospiraceae bacterium]
MFVRSKMTANPFTVSQDQTIPDAQEIMLEHHVKRLPVMKGNRLVGVVSRQDIAHASPSKATSLSMGELTYLLAKTPIKKVMSKNPVTISSGALLEEAATMMRDNDVSFLPVVDDGALVGIITESDIFDSFIELLGFREQGTRLTIEATDAPGILAGLTGIFGEHGANITHVAVYRGAGGKSDVVVGTNSQDTTAIEKALAEKGLTVVYKLVNS